MSHEQYRYAYVDGLKGLAIAFVVIFHLWPDVFPCCYYGVEIFFVISGYLIFSNLSRRKGGIRESGKFFCRRISRIMPPLVVVTMATLIAGSFLLNYESLESLSRMSRYTVLGAANVHLNKLAADYFARDLSTGALTHMWYVAVIMQIYLMIALGNTVCRRLPRKWLLFGLATIGVISFFCCYGKSIIDLLKALGMPVDVHVEAPGYFDTVPRIWEVLGGACVLMLPAVSKKWIANILSALGIAAVIVPPLLLQNNSLLMLPIVVCGTMLSIRYLPASSLERLFSNKLMATFGTLSYSIFLIHLPVFVLYKSWFWEIAGWHYAAMLLLTLFLSWLCWRFVEARKISWKLWVPIWLLVLALGQFIQKTDGLSKLSDKKPAAILPSYKDWRVVRNAKVMKGYDKEALPRGEGVFDLMVQKNAAGSKSAYFLYMGKATSHPNVLMMGDSHAQAIYAGMDHVFKRNGLSGVFITSTLSPFWNKEVEELVPGSTYYCDRQKMVALQKWLQEHTEIQFILVAQYWNFRIKSTKYDWDKMPTDNSAEAMLAALREFCLNMQALNKKVIMLAPCPDFIINPATYLGWLNQRGRNPEQNMTPLQCSRSEYEYRHADVLKMLHILESERLCSVLRLQEVPAGSGFFSAYENGMLLYGDKDHFSVPGSIRYINTIQHQLLELLQPVKPGPTHQAHIRRADST